MGGDANLRVLGFNKDRPGWLWVVLGSFSTVLETVLGMAPLGNWG